MKKLTLTLILLVLLPVLVTAQEQSLLWEIDHPSLKQPSYLFGTIHVLCNEDRVENERVKEALEKVDRIVFELDFSDPQLPQKMRQASMGTGEPLDTYLTDEEIQVLDRYFRKHLGAGFAQLNRLKPFALTSMAMQPMMECSEQIFSYEGYLMQKAGDYSIPVTGLETPEFQFQLFDNQPVREQLDELVNGVMNPDSVKQVFDSLVTAYNWQDIESLYHTFLQSSAGSFKTDILDDRNRAWIPVIEKVMSKEPVFIAIGAMHLSGENGVIELLRSRGYTLTPFYGS